MAWFAVILLLLLGHLGWAMFIAILLILCGE